MNRLHLASAFVALALLGCGGAGSRPDTPRSAAKQAVLRTIARAIGLNANESSGIGKSGLRRFAQSSPLTSRPSSRTVEPDYDDVLKLWSTASESGTTTTTSYFLDEALTTPAGSKVTVVPAGPYPYTVSSNLSITAGPNAGMRSTSSEVHDSDTSWRTVKDFTFPGGETRHETYKREDGGTKSWTYDINDGEDYTTQCSGSVAFDGSGSMTTTSRGSTTTINFAADYTGDGVVTAQTPEEQQPTTEATFAWEADGTTTVHYADGTSETFAPE